MIDRQTAIEVLKEFQERQQHAVNAYVPSDEEDHNQLSYHKSGARYRLLFGGNQSGKSHAAAFDCAVNARGRNPYNDKFNITGRDVEIWVISTEYNTIKSGMYRHLKNLIPRWDLAHEGPKVPGHPVPTYLEVKRKDGYKTTINFMSSKGDSSARSKFQGAAIDFFYIDEEITGDIWDELEARTLATGGFFSISATLVESYAWIMELEKLAERGDPNIFITRLNTELNPYLNTDTVKLLKSKWSRETLEYRFYGRARQATGLIYNTWTDDNVCEPFEIPKDWPRWCAIDPGIRTCAALWIAVDPHGTKYIYRELYAHNEPLWQVALDIKKLEGWRLNQELTVQFGHYTWEETDRAERMINRLIDPKGRARSEAGEESILSQLYTRFGLICTPADNALRPGIEDCRFSIESGLKCFDTLINFLDERRNYRSRPANRKKDANDPIEDPVRQRNHLMDCWRYIEREHPSWQDRVRMPGHIPVPTASERIASRKQEELIHDQLGTEW